MHALIILLLVVLIMSRLPGWLYLGLLCLVLLVACGGGGGGGSAPVAATVATAPPAPAACTTAPYYPLCDGSSITYSATEITAAHYDAPSAQLVLDGLGNAPAIGATLNETVSLAECNGLTVHEIHYAFGRVATTADPYLGDAAFSEGGIAYEGEFAGSGQVLSVGEPILTVSPREGEEIYTTYESAPACGETPKPMPSLTTWYRTDAHYAQWTAPDGQVFADVWESTLIEHPGQADNKVYTYYTQRGVGIVAFACWATDTPASNTYTDCGNLYIKVS